MLTGCCDDFDCVCMGFTLNYSDWSISDQRGDKGVLDLAFECGHATIVASCSKNCQYLF